jgi:hypothetical protein
VEETRTYYALTNKRALIVVSGFRGRSSSSTYFENLSLIDKRVRSDGNGIISFGGPVTAEWQWGNGKPPRPPTFDDIDNADTVYQIANRLLDQARKGTQEAVSRWSQ